MIKIQDLMVTLSLSSFFSFWHTNYNKIERLMYKMLYDN